MTRSANYLLIILALAFIVSGCAWTHIQKPDGTDITHRSLFVNTKNITIIDDTTSADISSQVIDLDALQAAINLMRASQKKGVAKW